VPRRYYSPDYKTVVLRLLDAYDGDVALTSLETGIPERTLRAWRIKHHARSIAPGHLPPSSNRRQFRRIPLVDAPSPPADPPENELLALRQHLMRDALTLAASVEADLTRAPLAHRVVALSHLVDRIMKLDARLPRPRHESVIRIEYVDPQGNVSTTPPVDPDDDSLDDDDPATSGA